MDTIATKDRTLQNSDNPPLNLGGLALVRFKLRMEKHFKASVRIRAAQPFGCREGVLLVGRSPFAWESPVPQRRIYFRNRGAVGRHAPPVERPEMDTHVGAMPDVAQPRNARVRGFRHRPLHVEMENGFGCSCPQFGHPPPAGIA